MWSMDYLFITFLVAVRTSNEGERGGVMDMQDSWLMVGDSLLFLKFVSAECWYCRLSFRLQFSVLVNRTKFWGWKWLNI